MNKCVGAIEEFEFLPLSSGKHLHLTIAVTGWLCSGKYGMYDFTANVKKLTYNYSEIKWEKLSGKTKAGGHMWPSKLFKPGSSNYLAGPFINI